MVYDCLRKKSHPVTGCDFFLSNNRDIGEIKGAATQANPKDNR